MSRCRAQSTTYIFSKPICCRVGCVKKNPNTDVFSERITSLACSLGLPAPPTPCVPRVRNVSNLLQEKPSPLRAIRRWLGFLLAFQWGLKEWAWNLQSDETSPSPHLSVNKIWPWAVPLVLGGWASHLPHGSLWVLKITHIKCPVHRLTTQAAVNKQARGTAGGKSLYLLGLIKTAALLGQGFGGKSTMS